MFRYNRGPHRSLGAIDWRLMQHREKPLLRAPLDRRGPSVGAGRCRMPSQVEDVHHTFPYGLAVECLADRNGWRQRRGAAVHAFDSLFELIDFNFGHVSRISWTDGGGHAIGGLPDDVARPATLLTRGLSALRNTSSRWLPQGTGLEIGEGATLAEGPREPSRSPRPCSLGVPRTLLLASPLYIRSKMFAAAWSHLVRPSCKLS